MTPQGGSVAPRRHGAAEIDALAAEVAAALGSLPGVVAVAAAGSHLAGADDPDSDIDLYVYAAEPPPLAARAALAARFATAAEIGNEAWEPGDEWVAARTGIAVDVIYRTPAWIETQLDRVLVRHEAALGCSTCFWHNLRYSRPLVDRDGWYRRLQAAAARPYPEPLKRAVVARNHPVLRQTLSSYRHQIALAVRRDDAVSIQHRTTALLASSFDIIFAVNELPHPGEKRLLWHATTRCARLPAGFADDVSALLGVAASPAGDVILARVDALLDGLDDLLADEGLLPTR
ncbi:MAG: DUF4037 domain-containing protein [Chloroflexia bacterium]|nr:DUF4037 domain-containing protein [Chloroflexia bacterium]